MKEQNKKYIDYDEYLKKEEKSLNSIYNDLLKDNEDKNAIKKFDKIVKSNIDYRGIIPNSKSYQGESLLTLSKTWMIIILLKINKGRAQQDQFLTLVNSSLTHELNEYEEYKNFFDDQCELVFSEQEAIKRINLNQKLPKKLDDNISHDELRNYYIYLLYKPHYFQKNDYEEMSKPKKRKYERKEFERSKSKDKKTKKDTKNVIDDDIELKSENDSDDDEKGDRLDENEMISKNRAKKTLYPAKNKKIPSSNKERDKINKRKSEKEDKDYKTINEILNKKKSEKKTEKKKRKKSIDKSEEDEDITIEDLNETKKGNKNKKKVGLKAKKNKNIKNKKYEEEFEEEGEEEIADKKNKNKKEKEKKGNKSEKEKKKKEEKKKKRTSANKIFELLGIDSNLIEEEEEDDDDEDNKKEKKKKERKTVSIQPKKKEKSNKKTKKESSNKKEKEKEKEKKGKRKNRKKTKKSISDDEDEFLSEDDFVNNLTDLKDSLSDDYGTNLDEDEQKKMEREINAALEGNVDDLDLEELLADSQMEGISLSQLESKSKSSYDLESD